MTVELSILTGPPATPTAPFLVRQAESVADLAAYRSLRRQAFVVEQGLFDGTDLDEVDDDPRTVVLVATAPDGTVLGGVRVAPRTEPDSGWWAGSRLVVARGSRRGAVGPALVRAACAFVETAGVLRFDAVVQARYAAMFASIGWITTDRTAVHGTPHVVMRWPIGAVQRLVDSTKAVLATALAPFADARMGLGGSGFRGDDGAPVPGSDLVAACDAIVPSMVERDPEWAGWCAALVNVNDLSAMGAAPVGLLDAVGAPTASHLARVVRGLARASQVWGVPVLGGHTHVGVPAALSVTALGRTSSPVPAGGGRVGDHLRLTVDLGGGWRPGYTGTQWDSTSTRSSDELRAMGSFVARATPHAAKDVSMAGLAGTAGMLAEASGTGVELDVTAIPRPDGVETGRWLTCFPGFAMITADSPGHTVPDAGPATTAVCGRLTSTPGVTLRWPDGVTTTAVESAVTGLGRA
ncbi:MSMEG_0567/sll0787 family protein [Rhodococcoides kroppenstedtii]|uniref:MSMEG_0567/sll0787 family protein n=1 Tax=Rhodococcoides kroppenstedtii TaxID=293050 RepID=UPI001BDECADB|nr:MSMEG_0567/sll0787 family protein [Rhodococcus kroppenstedtii]MBT1193988.1 AIR synthase [Rhodococcus kroppenstedtii]